jgi:hypothetical protein
MAPKLRAVTDEDEARSFRHSLRAPSRWASDLGHLLGPVGKWIAAGLAPILAAAVVWLNARIDTERATTEKIKAEAAAIVDARQKLTEKVGELDREQAVLRGVNAAMAIELRTTQERVTKLEEIETLEVRAKPGRAPKVTK